MSLDPKDDFLGVVFCLPDPPPLESNKFYNLFTSLEN